MIWIKGLLVAALTCSVLFVCTHFAASVEQAPASTAPLYSCHRIDRYLQLSGKLDDPLWQSAEAITLTDPVDGTKKAQGTTVRLLYNDRYLYLGYSCEDSYIWGTHTKRDAPIYEQECVEVFLCPSGKMRQYYEFEVSPRNTIYDAFVLNGRDATNNSNVSFFLDYTAGGMRTKVNVDGELDKPSGARGWTAELAIPFSALIGSDHLTPVPGDEWLMNLYRIDMPTDSPVDYSAWSPPGAADFHLPQHFGRLRFE